MKKWVGMYFEVDMGEKEESLNSFCRRFVEAVTGMKMRYSDRASLFVFDAPPMEGLPPYPVQEQADER